MFLTEDEVQARHLRGQRARGQLPSQEINFCSHRVIKWTTHFPKKCDEYSTERLSQVTAFSRSMICLPTTQHCRLELQSSNDIDRMNTCTALLLSPQISFYLRQSLSVCLLARLLKNACMDLDEMLCVDRCRDMDELINFWARSGSQSGSRNRIYTGFFFKILAGYLKKLWTDFDEILCVNSCGGLHDLVRFWARSGSQSGSRILDPDMDSKQGR